MKEIKEKYKKVIGYYGALAKWFDYKLVDKVAKKYPDFAIVIIGLDSLFSEIRLISVLSVGCVFPRFPVDNGGLGGVVKEMSLYVERSR